MSNKKKNEAAAGASGDFTEQSGFSGEGDPGNDPQPSAEDFIDDNSAQTDEISIEELKARLKQAEETAEMLQHRYRQSQAQIARETEELRARLRRTADEKLVTAKADIYQHILEFADNLERALQAVANGAEPITLVEGVKATLNLLLRQLENDGVKPIQAVGEPFDPSIHEAVDLAAVPPEQDGQVLQVYKTGYKIGDKLLRPAVVKVGRSN